MSVMPFIGQISAFAFEFAPVGWLACDGADYFIADYPQLYSLLGTSYGGDGVSMFRVPDFRNCIPMGKSAVLPLGMRGSLESTTLPGDIRVVLEDQNLMNGNADVQMVGWCICFSGSMPSPV